MSSAPPPDPRQGPRLAAWARWPVRLGAGVLGGLGVAGAVVAVTAIAVDLGGAATPAPAPVSSPLAPLAGPSAAPAARTAAAAVAATVVGDAEAQALGITPRELTQDLRQGMTIHQLATQRGMTEATFLPRYQAALKTILDTAVQRGQLAPQQEQAALTRLGATVPNWDTVQASPLPRASPSAAPGVAA